MTVRVERAGNRIFLASSAPTPGLTDAIPGSYWRARDGVWSMPLDLTICHLLRERFGNRLEIGPILTAWAKAEKATRAAAEATAGAADAEIHNLPKVAPRLHAGMASRTYQRAAVRFVVDSRGRDGRRRALIADTVGLGKTAEAIGAVLESQVVGPYLVVCPLGAVDLAWTPELRRWLDAPEIITLPTGKAARETVLNDLEFRKFQQDSSDISQQPYARSLHRTWVIVHPEAMRTQTWWQCADPLCGPTKYKAGPVDYLDCGHEKSSRTKVVHEHVFPQLFALEYGAVIADESDQCLIRLTGTPNLRRRGMEMIRDLVRPEGLRIAMSGTPFRSKPHQLWSTLNWLDPVRWSGKWRWIQQYWKTGGYSGYEIVQDGFMEEREALMIAELGDVMIRRTREEVRGDLPAKLYPSNVSEDSGLTPGIYLPMSAKQAKAYAQMAKTGSADIEGGELNTIGILAEMTRLKQFAAAPGYVEGTEFHPLAEGNKYDWIVEFMRELGFPDKPASKLVIASQFTQLLNVFRNGLAKEFSSRKEILRSGMITGEITGERRKQFVDEFEDVDSDLNLLLINTKAGGSAITLDAADVMVVLDETYVDDDQQQLEGRIDNRNPERKIVPRSYYYLRSVGTIEEHIAAANAEAKKRGQRVLDGPAIARRAKELLK
jgi:SNF2-related domain